MELNNVCPFPPADKVCEQAQHPNNSKYQIAITIKRKSQVRTSEVKAVTFVGTHARQIPRMQCKIVNKLMENILVELFAPAPGEGETKTLPMAPHKVFNLKR